VLKPRPRATRLLRKDRRKKIAFAVDVLVTFTPARGTELVLHTRVKLVSAHEARRSRYQR
jgi:hypothetical protein